MWALGLVFNPFERYFHAIWLRRPRRLMALRISGESGGWLGELILASARLHPVGPNCLSVKIRPATGRISPEGFLWMQWVVRLTLGLGSRCTSPAVPRTLGKRPADTGRHRPGPTQH